MGALSLASSARGMDGLVSGSFGAHVVGMIMFSLDSLRLVSGDQQPGDLQPILQIASCLQHVGLQEASKGAPTIMPRDQQERYSEILRHHHGLLITALKGSKGLQRLEQLKPLEQDIRHALSRVERAANGEQVIEAMHGAQAAIAAWVSQSERLVKAYVKGPLSEKQAWSEQHQTAREQWQVLLGELIQHRMAPASEQVTSGEVSAEQATTAAAEATSLVTEAGGADRPSPPVTRDPVSLVFDVSAQSVAERAMVRFMQKGSTAHDWARTSAEDVEAFKHSKRVILRERFKPWKSASVDRMHFKLMALRRTEGYTVHQDPSGHSRASMKLTMGASIDSRMVRRVRVMIADTLSRIGEKPIRIAGSNAGMRAVAMRQAMQLGARSIEVPHRVGHEAVAAFSNTKAWVDLYNLAAQTVTPGQVAESAVHRPGQELAVCRQSAVAAQMLVMHLQRHEVEPVDKQVDALIDIMGLNARDPEAMQALARDVGLAMQRDERMGLGDRSQALLDCLQRKLSRQHPLSAITRGAMVGHTDTTPVHRSSSRVSERSDHGPPSEGEPVSCPVDGHAASSAQVVRSGPDRQAVEARAEDEQPEAMRSAPLSLRRGVSGGGRE